MPTIAVDTHVFRVSNRTGLAYGKNPDEVQQNLYKVVPKKYLKKAGHTILLHGRYTCKARKPFCKTCVIRKYCKFKNKDFELVKVLGIGNAIVDVVCKVEESFITKNNLTKGTMKLVDEAEFKKLLSNLKIEETIAGGSVANSIVGLSQLGNPVVSFIGKVNNDELGNKYEKSLTNEKVKYCYQKKKEPIPTGTCLILITPDSERTMCTFLGIAGKISDKDIDENAVKNSELIFLEGYLWDEGDPRKAFNKAISVSKKTAMSLSDQFCVATA